MEEIAKNQSILQIDNQRGHHVRSIQLVFAILYSEKQLKDIKIFLTI